MATQPSEEELTRAAEDYLKTNFGEDTISMQVIDNHVRGGTGVLHVNCTVSVGGATSNWNKWFTFTAGAVTDLRARQR